MYQVLALWHSSMLFIRPVNCCSTYPRLRKSITVFVPGRYCTSSERGRIRTPVCETRYSTCTSTLCTCARGTCLQKQQTMYYRQILVLVLDLMYAYAECGEAKDAINSQAENLSLYFCMYLYSSSCTGTCTRVVRSIHISSQEDIEILATCTVDHSLRVFYFLLIIEYTFSLVYK